MKKKSYPSYLDEYHGETDPFKRALIDYQKEEDAAVNELYSSWAQDNPTAKDLERKAQQEAAEKAQAEEDARIAADANMSTKDAVWMAAKGNIKGQIGGVHRMAAAALDPDKSLDLKMGLAPAVMIDAVKSYVDDAPLRHAQQKLRNLQAKRSPEEAPEANLSSTFLAASNPLAYASKAGGDWLRRKLDNQNNGEELTEEEKLLLNPKQDYEGYRGALRQKGDEWADEGRSDAARAATALTPRPDNAILSPLQYAKYVGQQAAVNLPSQAIALAGGVATRSPAVYAALSAGPVVADEFGRRDRAGEKGAALHATLAGVEEGLGEIGPGKILFGNALKKYASSRMGAAGLAIAGEGGSEAVTSGLNSLHKVILDGEPVTVTQAFRDAVDAGVIGMVAGPSSGAVAFVTADPGGKTATEYKEINRQIAEQAGRTDFGDDAVGASDIVPDLGQTDQAVVATEDQFRLPEEALSGDEFNYTGTSGKPGRPARGSRTLDTAYADKEWEKTFAAQEKAAQRAAELQQKADVAAEKARTNASAMVAKRAEVAQRRADEARAIADAKEAELYDPQANGQQGFRDYLTAPQSSAPAPVNRSKDPYANTAISQDGFRGSLQAKPARKVKTIAPETAYDAAQSGAVVAPVKIKSAEEISTESETTPPIEPIQPSELADDFVFNPYAQDSEIQSSLKLGNRGAEVGFESELDYKGPRIKPPVDYSPAQSTLPLAASAPEASSNQINAHWPKIDFSRAAPEGAGDKLGQPFKTENVVVRGKKSIKMRTLDVDQAEAYVGDRQGEFFAVQDGILFVPREATYAEGLSELSSRNGAFKTEIPKGETVEEIVASVYPGTKASKFRTYREGIKAVSLEVPDSGGKTAYIYQTDDKVWIDVSELKVGNGGSNVYRIASALANATGKKFYADPDSISALARSKRPEILLSEGAKYGNFELLEPGQADNPSEPTYSIPHYKGEWNQKADVLAQENLNTVVAAYPEIADIVTNGENFVNANTGEIVTDEQFNEISNKDPTRNVPRGYRAGRGTLKRAAFFNTFSPRNRETHGVAALARLSKFSNNDLPKSLRGILYSKASAPVAGASRERIGKAFNRAFGAGSFERAVKSGRIQIHDSTSDVPGTPDDAQGAYEHKHDGGGDVIHLFSSNLNESNIAGVVLHEYAHRGFEDAVGGSEQAKKIYDVMLQVSKRDPEMGDALKRAVDQVGAENTNDVSRETLSYFLENRQNKGVPNALYEAIVVGVRKGLRAIGIKLKESDSEFKRRIMDIARTSLKVQIDSDGKPVATSRVEYSSKEQQASDKKATGEATLNPKIEVTNFDKFDRTDSFSKNLKEKLLDRTRLLKEIKLWQIAQGTYSALTDLHTALNTYKDAVAGRVFGLKSRQQNFINRIKADGRDGKDFAAKDVGIWAALNKVRADAISGKPDKSGITSERAKQEYERLLPFKAKLDPLVKIITDNHKEALEIRKNLLTKEQYEERLKDDNFVELRGSDNPALQGKLEHAVPGLYGVNVAGKEYSTDGTRDSEPNYDHIIAYSFADVEQAHMRTAWNEVALTIARFAIANPNNPFVRFQPALKETIVNPVTGLQEVVHKKPALSEKFINFKNNGIPYTIEMIDTRFESAIKSTVRQKTAFERLVGPVVGRFQGAVLKTANFLVIQKIRDTQEISLYLSLHFGPKVAARAVALHPAAWGAFRRAMKDEADLSNPTDVALKKWLDSGGLTQIVAPESVETITKRIRDNLMPDRFSEGAKGVAASLWSTHGKSGVNSDGNLLNSLEDMMAGVESAAKKMHLTKPGEILENLQVIGENIGRFTAYQAILEANPTMNPKTALWHSKESGANFSVKGEWAGYIGCVIPFYNAIAAGLMANKNYFNELRKNKKAIAAFGVAVGTAVAAGIAAADDDDEDGNSKFLNLSQSERASNFIIMGLGKTVKIPIPQGAVAAINMVAQSVGPMARLIAEGDEKGQERLYQDVFQGVMKNMGPDISMTGEVDFGILSEGWKAAANKDDFGRPLDYRPEDEKILAEYRSGRLEGFLANFIPGYLKEGQKIATATSNAVTRNSAIGAEYARIKALEDVRGLPLFKIFLASASGKTQAANRILYDARDVIAAEKARIKKINKSEDIKAARAALKTSPLLSQAKMATNGNITVRGNGMAARNAEALKEIRKLRALKREWYNKSELNDALLDATADVVDTSDIKTDNFKNFRQMAIEKINKKVAMITTKFEDK